MECHWWLFDGKDSIIQFTSLDFDRAGDRDWVNQGQLVAFFK
jgi:hypothetical protein